MGIFGTGESKGANKESAKQARETAQQIEDAQTLGDTGLNKADTDGIAAGLRKFADDFDPPEDSES